MAVPTLLRGGTHACGPKSLSRVPVPTILHLAKILHALLLVFLRLPRQTHSEIHTRHGTHVQDAHVVARVVHDSNSHLEDGVSVFGITNTTIVRSLELCATQHLRGDPRYEQNTRDAAHHMVCIDLHITRRD